MKLIVAVALVVMVFAAPNDKKDNANKRFLGQGGFGQGHGHGGGGGFGGGHHGGGGGFGGGHHGGGGGFGGGHHGGGTSKCRFWCKNPRGQFYCCENNNQQPGPVGHKRGRCPPVRPVCPQGVRFGPPQTCSNDYSCNGADKCCFDSCLEQHVCKQPIRGGFNPGVGVGIGGGGGLGGLGGILGGILGGGGHNVGGHHNVGGFARKKP